MAAKPRKDKTYWDVGMGKYFVKPGLGLEGGLVSYSAPLSPLHPVDYFPEKRHGFWCQHGHLGSSAKSEQNFAWMKMWFSMFGIRAINFTSWIICADQKLPISSGISDVPDPYRCNRDRGKTDWFNKRSPFEVHHYTWCVVVFVALRVLWPFPPLPTSPTLLKSRNWAYNWKSHSCRSNIWKWHLFQAMAVLGTACTAKTAIQAISNLAYS